MIQLNLDQIRAKLSDRRLTVVASRTGLSAETVANVYYGRGTPRPATLAKLSNYLLTL